MPYVLQVLLAWVFVSVMAMGYANWILHLVASNKNNPRISRFLWGQSFAVGAVILWFVITGDKCS